MSTMAENVIAAGAENRPPMLERSQYDSWHNRMLLYIRGKEHGIQLLESVKNGPFKFGTVEVPATLNTPASTRNRTLDDLTPKEKIRKACDIRETNIILQVLPLDVYTLVNHHTIAKEIWDKVILIIEGSELSLQEQESKLHNEFDRFTSEKGETIHSYYLRFAKMINDMNTIGMTMQKLQSYEAPIINHQSYEAPVFHQQPYQALAVYHQSPAVFPQLDSCLVVPKFLPTNDPIESLNKAMAFLSTTITSRYPQTNNQLRTSSNLRNQATIQDGRVIVQNVQGRQTQSYTGNFAKGKATRTWASKNTGNATANQARVIQCYNCRDDIDAFDSDCDEMPTTNNNVIDQSVHEMQYSKQPVFVDDSNIVITSDNNVISYDQYMKEIKSEVVQDTSSSEQKDALLMSVIEEMSNQVAKCNAVNQENKTVNESLTVELEGYKKQVNFFKERHKFELTDREKHIDSQMRGIIVDRNAKFEAFQKEIQTLKLQLSANIKDNKSLNTQMDVLKKDVFEKQEKYIEEFMDLENKKKALDNIVYKMGQTIQTMHMLMKPQVFYDYTYKTALGYQNPLYLCKA
ncbi:hypothetical protein Tco_0554765 [Tanacetum coccineum]